MKGFFLAITLTIGFYLVVDKLRFGVDSNAQLKPMAYNHQL